MDDASVLWIARASDHPGRFEFRDDARQHRRIQTFVPGEFRQTQRSGARDGHQHLALAGGKILLRLGETKAPIEPPESDAKVLSELSFLFTWFSCGVRHITSLSVVACQQATTFHSPCHDTLVFYGKHKGGHEPSRNRDQAQRG